MKLSHIKHKKAYADRLVDDFGHLRRKLVRLSYLLDDQEEFYKAIYTLEECVLDLAEVISSGESTTDK